MVCSGKNQCVYLTDYIAIFRVSRKSRRIANDPNWLSGTSLVFSVSGKSIFMLLILFDPTSIIFICSTDRTCIC